MDFQGIASGANTIGARNSSVPRNTDKLEELSNQAKKKFQVNDSDDPDSKQSADDEKIDKLKKKANEIEGMVLGIFMGMMRKTVKESEGPFSKGRAAKMFRERLDKQYANKIAKSRKLGIAEKVYDQLSARMKK